MGRKMSGRRKALLERDGDACFYCGEQMRFEPSFRKTWRGTEFRVHPADEATIEHLLDKQHGGTDDLSNLVLSCKRCNNGRNYMTLEQKMESRL